MTRVLMTADAVGGVWTYALELADALAPLDVEVHLATMGRPLSSDQWAAVERSAVAEVFESSYALEWMPEPWHDVDRAGRWLLDLAAKLRPDVVHLNGYAHASLPWDAPAVVVAHSDVVSWWRAVHGVAAPPEWDVYRERIAAGLTGAAAVIAPTAAVLDDLRVGYGFSGGRVIPNCRRSDWVHPIEKEPMVLGAGRAWDQAKGLDALERASVGLPWPVHVAGDGGSLGRLPFDQLAQWLLRSAIFAAPASYEPFGLGILEAAQAGCALVIGDIASLREVWADAAVYVPPGDAAALGEVLHIITADADRVAILGQQARERALTYSPQRTGAAYADVYAALPQLVGSR